MRELILVSKTPIVIQIFTLITKKLNIKLVVLHEAQIDHKVDIIVIDKEFIDSRFSILKTYSKQIGAISNEELPFDLANDFTIPLPFLPSNLQTILEEQLQIIIKRANSKTYITNVEEDFDEDIESTINYIDNLDSVHDEYEEEDESDGTVSIASLNNQGGILDTNELYKIKNNIEHDENIKEPIYAPKPTTNYIEEENEDQWCDLSSIIDHAINEVNSDKYLEEHNADRPIKLLLNNYSLNELTPLLNLLNQDVINRITNGEEIMLQIKLGHDNEK